MAAFGSFNDRLPDPTFTVNDAGAVAAGSSGPGFASVRFTTNEDTEMSRTRSGRGIHRDMGAHYWEFTISYNDMLRDQFDLVDTFLLARKPRKHPFYVVLPQYSRPKNPAFATFATNNDIRAYQLTDAGSSYMLVDAEEGAVAFTSTPKPGDFFNIDDPNDANHQKAYKVTRVETTTDYLTSLGSPGTNRLRLHFHPPLVRDVAANAELRFINPEFRVISKESALEYTLTTDNLYQFQLSLEEIQP